MPGSKWWKFDVHCHTPASTNDFPTVSHRDWLLAAMASGVDCFAVTDHNSGAWIDPLKDELKRLDQEKPGRDAFDRRYRRISIAAPQ